MEAKNASEPMWFRGVAASMGLCLDLGAVLEGHLDVVLAVDCNVVHHCQPPALGRHLRNTRREEWAAFSIPPHYAGIMNYKIK